MKGKKYQKLRGRIEEVYGSHASFARALGIDRQALSRKLCGQIGITARDVQRWARMLGIDRAEWGYYFFE